MAGYSGTPLVKKLGIKEGFRIALVNAPENFQAELGELPADVKFMKATTKSLDLILFFVLSERILARDFAKLAARLTSNGMGSTTVKLLKPDGTQLTSTTSSAVSFNLATQTLPTTGTYTISIDPSGTNVGSITVNVTNP